MSNCGEESTLLEVAAAALAPAAGGAKRMALLPDSERVLLPPNSDSEE